MPSDFIEALTALDLILDEETARLEAPGYDPLMPALIDAKTRAVGMLDRQYLRVFGDGADRGMIDDLPPEARGEMIRRVAATLERLRRNAGLLERRIALCDDLLAAIAGEAKRATGGRTTVYGARGAIARNDQATPISINTRL